ncbi:glucose-1-phosphate adenylyltransferase subunit GlgD [Paenibacillus polymyxa]|uniref:Glucose-1-phosphate adenylyltransferase subunit GlgD n=1 Tax=Paenibacillus polymyxa TaxID=1406 RepID=A0A8I1ITM3_PAEPO|nr:MULTISPECIES: glucose-1-phosphate adenylyltransferase subunit GlgD [Paenibacillus]KAF6574171.1 glucose-1-phosphate adenylyltransferase subunit GlgD [Paenibacillus sp. EKM206P]KAF6588642.1 glucose-1-phosphate adenylyltransferase subunit GlgD [Paenibacillus sp. EKM205P]MBM0632838.1 glucose-1-phosphate adenylyltransferase subunit GlgD [Paenibacillus polymyxa]
MSRLIGVINLDHELDQLKELTYFRCGAAVPFASRYRLIDFTLSNMMHAGVHDIALFIRRKYRSLLDHLGEGRPWDLDRRRGGLFILPPDWNDPTDASRGDLQHVHNNLDFFHRSSGQTIIHAGTQHVNKVDIEDVYRYHQEKNADVTLVYKPIDQLESEHDPCARLEIDENGRVTGIHQEQDHHNIYLEMFVMDKDLYLDQVKHCIAHQDNHFFRDAIQKNPSGLRIYAYHYEGYHAVINSIESYYKNSMKLLDQQQYQALFQNQPVHTKIKYEAPTRYTHSAEVDHSLVANGCTIGGKVENSILFRGVRVEEGARVSNSIIMQKCVIRKGAVVENVVLDKDVQLSPDRTLIGDIRVPYVIAKNSVI